MVVSRAWRAQVNANHVGEDKRGVAALSSQAMNIWLKRILAAILAGVAIWLFIHVPAALTSGPQMAAGTFAIAIGCLAIAGWLLKP
jgi:hypothetical protein